MRGRVKLHLHVYIVDAGLLSHHWSPSHRSHYSRAQWGGLYIRSSSHPVPTLLRPFLSSPPRRILSHRRSSSLVITANQDNHRVTLKGVHFSRRSYCHFNEGLSRVNPTLRSLDHHVSHTTGLKGVSWLDEQGTDDPHNYLPVAERRLRQIFLMGVTNHTLCFRTKETELSPVGTPCRVEGPKDILSRRGRRVRMRRVREFLQ